MNRLWSFLQHSADPDLARQVRAEAWALGARHRGEVLEGARAELARPGVSPARARLLKAVIRAQP